MEIDKETTKWFNENVVLKQKKKNMKEEIQLIPPTFKIIKKYYDTWQLYNKNEITFKPGVSILVGCNGTGKTTLLNTIKNQMEKYRYINEEKEDIGFMYFDNLHDGGSNAVSRYGFMNDLQSLALSVQSSEGENITNNFGRLVAQNVGMDIRRHNYKKYFILIDAVDSGLSIDGIVNIKDFFNFFMEKNPNLEVYIIVSANSYEMTVDERCIAINTLEEIEFKDYNDYKKYILKSSEIKEKKINNYWDRLEKKENKEETNND